MFTEQVTPLLITFDESPNIDRALAALEWAADIVIVDSGSTDGTLRRLAMHPAVRVFHRDFDTFADQCTFGLSETGIRTEWVLSLDADHVLSPALIKELRTLDPDSAFAGYECAFTYCVHGKPLRASLYPPRIVLFRRSLGRFVDDGHGHRIQVEGRVERLAGQILHDDRKSLDRWLAAQDGYMRLEAAKLKAARFAQLSWPDRLRKLVVVAPFAALFYALVIKRGLLDGRAGWHYAFQRTIAEALLSLRLLDNRLLDNRLQDDRLRDNSHSREDGP